MEFFLTDSERLSYNATPNNLDIVKETKQNTLEKESYDLNSDLINIRSILKGYKSILKDNFSCNDNNILNKYFKIFINNNIKKDKNCIGFFYILSDNDKLDILIEDNFNIRLDIYEAYELYGYLEQNKLKNEEIKLKPLRKQNELHKFIYEAGNPCVSNGLGFDLDKVHNINSNIQKLLETDQFKLVTQVSEQNEKYAEFFEIIEEDDGKHSTNLSKKNYRAKLTQSLTEKLTPIGIMVNDIKKTRGFGLLYKFIAQTNSEKCICQDESCNQFHLTTHSNVRTTFTLNQYPGSIHLKCESTTDFRNSYIPIEVLITKSIEKIGYVDADMYRFYCEDYKGPSNKCCTNITYRYSIECLNSMFNSINIDRYIEQLNYADETYKLERIKDRKELLLRFIDDISNCINPRKSNTINHIKDLLKKPINGTNLTRFIDNVLLPIIDYIKNLIAEITEFTTLDPSASLEPLFNTQINKKLHAEFWLDMLKHSNNEYIFFKYATREYQNFDVKVNNETKLIEYIHKINPIIEPQNEQFYSVRAAGSSRHYRESLRTSLLAANPTATIPDNCDFLEHSKDKKRVTIKYCDYCKQYLHNQEECCIINLLSTKSINYKDLNNIKIDKSSEYLLQIFYQFITISNIICKIMRGKKFLSFNSSNLNRIFNTIKPYENIIKLVASIKETNHLDDIKKIINKVVPLGHRPNLIEKLQEFLSDTKIKDEVKKTNINNILKTFDKNILIEYDTSFQESIIIKPKGRQLLVNYITTTIMADGGKKLNKIKKNTNFKSRKILHNLNKLSSKKIKSTNKNIKKNYIKKQSRRIKLKKNFSKKKT